MRIAILSIHYVDATKLAFTLTRWSLLQCNALCATTHVSIHFVRIDWIINYANGLVRSTQSTSIAIINALLTDRAILSDVWSVFYTKYSINDEVCAHKASQYTSSDWHNHCGLLLKSETVQTKRNQRKTHLESKPNRTISSNTRSNSILMKTFPIKFILLFSKTRFASCSAVCRLW